MEDIDASKFYFFIHTEITNQNQRCKEKWQNVFFQLQLPIYGGKCPGETKTEFNVSGYHAVFRRANISIIHSARVPISNSIPWWNSILEARPAPPEQVSKKFKTTQFEIIVFQEGPQAGA